ncbi:uncharacterized protein LOC117482507 isoform X3 [Trematomus bernacchii]|uniref:uncharacterized protein LOC117482507 isoform X3 n=1 Tax=Trematomus bernacchii TaxID=40690 RepID=UPI00146BDA7C|nr:uncharacterized protein LOC117482507 isoform X3 [Trematomus bernacchii]
MAELKRIKMCSLLILLLQFTGAAIGQHLLYLSARAEDEVTLPCNYVIDDQDKCNGTTWFFSDSGSTAALVRGGQVGEEARAKSDRLRVTENCSLVIKKVTEEDAGQYTYRQYNKANQQQGSDSQVYLSVVTMTEQQDKDRMWLQCSVSTYGDCRHTVKWLLQGQDVDKDHREIETSQSSCYASVIFPTSHFSYRPRSELFTCEVTADGKVQTFRPQSSDGDEQAATTSTTPTVTSSHSIKKTDWWLYMVLALVLVALLTTIVAFITWRKMKGKEARKSDSVGQTSNPAVNSPETNPATADPEEGVSYASISYTKNTNKKAEVKIENDADEGDAVTYSTVKASTNDPNSLYDTIS